MGTAIPLYQDGLLDRLLPSVTHHDYILILEGRRGWAWFLLHSRHTTVPAHRPQRNPSSISWSTSITWSPIFF